MLIWLGKQHLAQQDRMAFSADDSREFIEKLGAASDAAREAGDQAGMNAAFDALQRIADGEERAEVAYLEWLRAHGARNGGG
jgi:hypothetical protein